MVMAHFFLNLSLFLGGMLGFIIAAVSPAVVVREMLRLKEGDFGKRNEIPSTILAVASIHTLWPLLSLQCFWELKEDRMSVSFLMVPIEIILGISLGATIGFLFRLLFKRFHITDTKKVLLPYRLHSFSTNSRKYSP